VFSSADLESIDSDVTRNLLANGVRTVCCFPLVGRGRKLGTLGLSSLTENAFAPSDLDLLAQIASQVAIAVDNARAYNEIAKLKDRLAKEKLYLEEELHSIHNFGEIVGNSPALRQVLKRVEIEVPSDATVLVLGETGTGKEWIARALHRLSSRSGEGNFIKLNCAATPTGLLESELFGHERGAFTGAISQKIGRLELADKGTIFLVEMRIHAPVTHEEMAQRIGASRETVTRLLSELRKKDLIKLEGSTLVIKNRPALEALAV
jgi:formate hydrogenlyase transcriptional activator